MDRGLPSGLMCAITPLLNASLAALEAEATTGTNLDAPDYTPVETHVCSAALAAHVAARELAISAA